MITSRTSRGMTPTAAMPGAGGEAEALGLRPGVADHERRAHGAGGREDRRRPDVRARQRADDDAEVDDGLAPAVEDRVHERAELADLAGRPGQRAVEHVEDAADEDDDAADEPQLGAEEDGADRS